jgi:SOS-response transcriptional repressor LexA
VVLRPDHPTMAPIVVGAECAEFRILGKVIGVLRNMHGTK